MRTTRRASALALVALPPLLFATHLGAQQRRVDVKKFQWDPVVVHIAAEAPRGVEVFMSVKTKFWGLTWIHPGFDGRLAAAAARSDVWRGDRRQHAVRVRAG
jgi:hypothetical protein